MTSRTLVDGEDIGGMGESLQTSEIDDNAITDAKIASHTSTKIVGLPSQTSDIPLNDNVKTLFGTGSDASIKYDATNLIINPKEVGAGCVDISDSDLRNVRNLEINAPTELTISAGLVTVTQFFHMIDTELDASTDDLTDFQPPQAGEFHMFRSINGGRDTTFKDGTPMRMSGDFTFTNTDDHILFFGASLTVQAEISRSDNV